MHESFLRALQMHRPTLRARWEVLLRAEPINSPLGNPDALVHLMDWTLDRLFAEARRPRLRRQTSRSGLGTHCPCQRNPLLAYFATAERALVETLFVVGREFQHLDVYAREIGLEELKLHLAAIARSEIDTLCTVCQQAHAVPAQACPRRNGRLARRHAAVDPVAVGCG
jgi:hypothetical protein